MYKKTLIWICTLFLPLSPLFGLEGGLLSNAPKSAYDQLPKGRVGVIPEGVRQEVLSCRESLSDYCNANPKVLDVFDRLFLTMAAEGAFEGGLGEYASFLDAITFAAYHHRGQIRKCPERLPYIIHPVGVAYLLWSLGGVKEANALMGAVLHDVVEDTEARYEDIEKAFGRYVAGIVAEVTDDKSLPQEKRKAYQIVNAPYLSREAKLVKLADKLYNVWDVEVGQVIIWVGDRPYPWSNDRVFGYLEWAERVVDGLLGTNLALEGALKEVFSSKLKFT